MHLVFVDDAKQKPTRPGIKGDLIGAGGLAVPGDRVREAEQAPDALCRRVGFPDGGEFKWSPGRKLWMHENLVGQARADFFAAVIEVLVGCGCFAVIAMEDIGRSTAVRDQEHALDVVELLLERIANRLKDLPDSAVLVADRPGRKPVG